MQRFTHRKLFPSLLNYVWKSITPQKRSYLHAAIKRTSNKSWLGLGQYWKLFGVQYTVLYRLIAGKNHKGMATSAKEVDSANLVKEASIPNDSWSDKMLKRYNELMELCNDGKWQKIISYQNFSREERLFVRALDAPGKQYEYAMFFNKEEKCVRAVIQFGPWLQGPKGAVHGGAIATVFDSVTGVLAYNMGHRCATVNLNVNYHGFLPLYTTAECDAWISKIEGRKIFIDAELRSLDGKTVFDKCTSIWVILDSSDEETLKKQTLASSGSDSRL